MAFAFLIVYLVMTFVRPGEMDPRFAEVELMGIVSVAALVVTAFRLLTRRGQSLRSSRLALLVALFSWAGVSILLGGDLSGTAVDELLGFLKSSVVAFFLIVLNVDTYRRVRITAATLVMLGLLAVGQGVAAYHYGVNRPLYLLDLGGGSGSQDEATVLTESPEELGSTVEPDSLSRIRGLGYLGDPNDLANMLVALVPLIFAFRARRTGLLRTVVLWAAAGTIVYGMYLTRSRGGIVALAGVVTLLVRRRIGKTPAVVLGIALLLGMVALGMTSGREIGVDESASGRIEAWSDGLQMLKSSPIWGVGFGQFTQYHYRVAHNSFVHCFAELGFVGYMLWLGLITLALHDLHTVSLQGRAEPEHGPDAEPEVGDPEESGEEPAAADENEGLGKWAEAIATSVAGFLVGALFLSRTFDPILYVFLGLAVAMASVARERGLGPEPRDPVAWTARIAGLAVASIAAFWLYMRLFR